ELIVAYNNQPGPESTDTQQESRHHPQQPFHAEFDGSRQEMLPSHQATATTPTIPGPPLLHGTDHENGHAGRMAHFVDGAAEKQIADEAVAVRGHGDEIAMLSG